MIETIRKSIEDIQNALNRHYNFFICGEAYPQETEFKKVLMGDIETVISTSHITLIDNLIKELEGKKEKYENQRIIFRDSKEVSIELRSKIEALTDTITTLQSLRGEITNLIK